MAVSRPATKAPASALPGADGILAALPNPVLLVDGDAAIGYVNHAAEQFFAAGAPYLVGGAVADVVPYDSPLLALLDQVQRQGMTMSEYAVDLGTPKTGPRLSDITVAPVADAPGAAVIVIREASIAGKMDRQLTHRGAARMVAGMAAVLVHEIKNPLSGIRGAAQLLEDNVQPQDQALTDLIRDEVDRVCALVDHMEMFSDKPLQRRPVNIHQVLERVRKVSESGFARSITIVERYDPSLPPVYGNFDQLVQVFLNLVKNAAEAVPEEGGEIVLATAFRHGVRVAIPGSNSRLKLPLEVSVSDNGSGVPEDLRPHLFDPFVTTKAEGTGLGLALVAKLIGDHGGIVDCSSEPRRTTFRVMLPLHEAVGWTDGEAG
ncbi:MAG: ATP-binding protein [Alphaproteobacteria bacterium]|jgi:two-component system nitrogen regulation sensor histidine kinase GlnL|nr:ATP-binding protein [Alphaproteobacteria bacterium]